MDIDYGAVLPACVTPFDDDGDIDFESLADHGRWLGDIDGVSAIVCNGHAGEGLSLTDDERAEVVRVLVEATDGRTPIVAAIGGEGSRVAALEARRAAEAGASAVLLYPSHGWLRFGFQPGAPQDRHRIVAEESGLPQIIFEYPDATKATYDLPTLLDLCSLECTVAMKNGVRNMRRWDTEIPVIRAEHPGIKVLTCHDEYLLHTMWESDGALVGYGALAPEAIAELLRTAKAKDYRAAKAVHDALLPLTKAVYHRGSHMEATVALKLGLVQRGVIRSAAVRSPLLALDDAAADEVRAALVHANLAEPVALEAAAS